MNIQQIIPVMVFISVMGVGLWLRTILKKTFQIMDGHLISIRSDTTVGSRTHSETSRSM
jgi:hypothetical protein